MKKSSRFSVAAALLAGFTLTFIVDGTANAAASYRQISLSATVTGSSVTSSTKVSASSSTNAQNLGVCARRGGESTIYDFPLVSNTMITTAGTTVTKSRTFPAGTYTYTPCARVAGQWLGIGSSKTFTVGTTSPTTSTPPTSSSAPTSATSPTTTATPAPTGTVQPPPGNSHFTNVVYSESFDQAAGLGTVNSAYPNLFGGVYDGGRDTSKQGLYASNKVLSVAGGVLDFYLHSEGSQPLVSAPVPNGWKGQTYGRYEVDIKTTNMPGYRIAFLLWPESNQWNDGEIDFPEGSLETGATFRPASHLVGDPTRWDPAADIHTPTDATTGFHKAVTEWSPGLVVWYWDGVEVARTSNSAKVSNKPMYWALQAETSTDGSAVSTSVSGHLQVDNLKIYSYSA